MSHLPFQTCGQCSLYSASQKACRRFKSPMAASDYCSKFTTSDLTCAICGNMFLPSSLFIVDNYKLCAKCISQLETCTFCAHGSRCLFDEFQTSEPKYKTVQTGFVQAQIRNPDIVRQSCATGCLCYSLEKGCQRQFNYCENLNPVPLSEKLG